MQQEHPRPSSVPSGVQPAGATQGPQPWAWVEASIWTARLLAALDNGGTGGKWDSLMDKVTAPRPLAAAWKRGAANQGAAGGDGISITRFKARASHSLAALERDLRAGRYHPLPAKRVQMPKGQGHTPPTKLQTFFFGVGHLRMWIDPKDDIHLVRGHFYPLHQGTDQFAFACPVCLF